MADSRCRFEIREDKGKRYYILVIDFDGSDALPCLCGKGNGEACARILNTDVHNLISVDIQ